MRKRIDVLVSQRFRKCRGPTSVIKKNGWGRGEKEVASFHRRVSAERIKGKIPLHEENPPMMKRGEVREGVRWGTRTKEHGVHCGKRAELKRKVRQVAWIISEPRG